MTDGTDRIPWHLAVLGGALVAGIPAIATFVGIAFDLFPALEPEAPPEVRAVTITDVALAERDKDLGDGRVADALLFEVETVGYDEDDIAVDWLVLDAKMRERLPEMETPERWGVIDIDTRSDRVVGEINVPPPSNHTGCVFVRVLLQPESATSEAPGPNQPRLLLDAADTAPYDPIDPANPLCPDMLTSATPSP